MKIKFYKIRDAECDMCDNHREVVTRVDGGYDLYICRKCACEINRHARANERVVKAEKTKTEQ